MNWFEATLLSPYRKAFRKDKDGRLIIRDVQGIVIPQKLDNGGFRCPLTEEYDSFYDWKPLKEKK